MTAAYLFYAPQFRPLTPAGVIMPNAYVQFYVTLTTTPANVYADAGLGTPLANPVVADASGEFVAIYLDPTVTYRAQLYDEDDALIWDIDPLAPPRDVPVGTVVLFFGSAVARDAAYPTVLWQNCDGTNGSPDLRDRVPMGCSASLAPGDTGGGSGTTNTSSDGAHTHTGATGSTVLTSAEMPAHTHNVLGDTNSVSTEVNGLQNALAISIGGRPAVVATTHAANVGSTGTQALQNTGGGGGHTHTISSDGAHTHTVDTTPPFLALWYLYRKA